VVILTTYRTWFSLLLLTNRRNIQQNMKAYGKSVWARSIIIIEIIDTLLKRDCLRNK
jgi:hypothetical protein